MLLEAEVHSELRGFLRDRDWERWPHHLTMARLVARALRLGRPALIQTGSLSENYSLSYLTPALLARDRLLLVAPLAVQQRLLSREIPQLQNWLETDKPVLSGSRLPGEDFGGLLVTSPESWLQDRLFNQGKFPPGLPTLIDQADGLEALARQQLTASLRWEDWNHLAQSYPAWQTAVTETYQQLAQAISARPSNPYDCYLLEEQQEENLAKLLREVDRATDFTPEIARFWQQWQQEDAMLWVELYRKTGRVTLQVAPASLASALEPVWSQQPLVIMGNFLDTSADATIYRETLGLGQMLCLKFAPPRQSANIWLYLPDMPLPNTPEFQPAVFTQARTLISLYRSQQRFAVLLIEDVPMRSQLGAALAGEFGSRVQVDRQPAGNEGILVCGWDFWQQHQRQLPAPGLLIVATLPLPSLENPVVAARVAYHKQRHQDWFRLYLLPAAIGAIARGVLPLRDNQGVVALLDNRVNRRSYGPQILDALEPYDRLSYIHPNWFG